MFLRILYTIWRYLTRFLTILLVFTFVILLLAVSLAQIPYSKNLIKTNIEQRYHKTYQSELHIGSITGFIPFSIILDDILIKSDSMYNQPDTLIHVKSLEINLNPLDLISNRLSVQSLTIIEPTVNLYLEDDSRNYHINRALTRRDVIEADPENVAKRLEILSPFFTIQNGTLNMQTREGVLPKEMPQFLNFREIELSSFIELNEDQRFLDIQYLLFDLDQLSQQRVRLNGQVYSDENYVELNGFRMLNGTNEIRISGEAANVNLYNNEIRDQFLNARYRFNLDVDSFSLFNISFLFDGFSKFDHPISLQTNVEGLLEDLSFSRFNLKYGKNELEFVGDIKNILDTERMEYDLNIRRLKTNSVDFSRLISDEIAENLSFFDSMSTRGRLYGDVNRTDLEVRINSQESEISLDGDIQWLSVIDYQFTVGTRDFDLQTLQIDGLPSTSINSSLLIKGIGSNLDDLRLSMEGKIFETTIDAFTISEVTLNGEYSDSKITSNIIINDRGAEFSGAFDLDHSDIISIRFVGDATNLNIKNYVQTDVLAETDLDFNFNLDFRGRTFDELNGRLNLDINRAVVNGYTLGLHQFYADLTDLRGGQKELRFTSTLLDFTVSGDLELKRINEVLSYWMDYFESRLDDEILFTDQVDVDQDVNNLTDLVNDGDGVELTFFAVVKNASLLNAYILTLPVLDADLTLNGVLNADKDRLHLNGNLSGSSINYSDARLENFNAQLTSSLRYYRYLREFSAIDLNVVAQSAKRGTLSLGGFSTHISMLNDSVKINTQVDQIGDGNYGSNLSFNTLLRDSLLKFNITDFAFGNTNYSWNVEGNPVIYLNEDKKLIIDELNFINDYQQFRVSGVYSQDIEDEIMLEFRDLNLGMISSLIDGEISFDGTINGIFQTSSLFAEPSISGNLFIDHLKLNNRTVGDVTFRSVLNVPLNRFDINVDVLANAEKYAEYFAANNNIGQDIKISGWINTPDNPSVDETLYSFDVQLDQIDAWILTPIIPDIFISTEGLASGTGRLWGTLDRFDFTSEFDVHRILAVPQFLKTNYYLDGKVYVSREGGVVLENINVRDNKGGTGVLDGTVSFNDFNPERPLNLRLSLNRLEFLNNTFEADVPFYGNVAGTGVVSLTGTNVSPFLRTTTPVTTTLDSRLAIPLLDEASVEEQSRFIEFVKSFSEIYEPKVEAINVVSDTNTERSFLEVFRLDLQFISPGSTVQLVFDPLTGEILNATGNGRIRITLEDQELQMFGNFNISGGDYTFVGGDIFVRRFQLRDGGSISWEGDPDNARLNITTAYRSRPNIGVLTSTFINQQSRIPVDLILEITGTIQSLENTFYFEFPNAIDVSQNATELSLLNSEDQKLVQATSLLFTGGFIPVGTSADGQGELGSTLQARAGQVGLSQLLSNQINAILNNSLSILDVDFNLTGFDQADIGIALRLFDDRLILRGESQYNSDVTSGAETTLGDFGLTYRINRSLSLEVFHRRDPTLRSIVGNQSQAESINGVGLEAQFQFNTWKELRLRVWGQIRRLFGASDEDDQRTLTQ